MLCTPEGVACYESLILESEDCLFNCQGIYADVRNEGVDKYLISEDILTQYEKYKSGFKDDMVYPAIFDG